MSRSRTQLRLALRVAALTAFSAAAGCNGSDVPDLQGRFVGQAVSASGARQVVAEIAGVQRSGDAYQLAFDLYATLGSAKPTRFTALVQHDQVTLGFEPVGSGLILKRQGQCSALSQSGREVSFCWASGKLDLDATNPDASKTALHLTRDDALPPVETTGPGRAYSLDELMGRARFQGYAAIEEAERVFQARKGITVAQGNLLPHLNVRDLLAIASSGYAGIFEAAGDLLPFLFPSNWYKWKEAQSLAQAEEKSFASLRGNEMNAVEILYYGVLRDQAVLANLASHIDWLKRIQAALLVQEQAGSLPTGSADYFGVSIRALEQDRSALAGLVAQEQAQLAHGAALPAVGAISGLASVALPDLSQAQASDAAAFFRDAQLKSYEAASLRALASASANATVGTAFSFLDPGSDGSLGFGYPATIEIGQSHEREIQARVDETLSLVEQRSVEVAASLNSAIEGYRAATDGRQEANRRFEWLWERRLAGDTTLGDQDFLDGLTDLQQRILVFDTGVLSAQYAYLAANSQLQRLTLQGNYSDLEGGTPLEATGRENR